MVSANIVVKKSAARAAADALMIAVIAVAGLIAMGGCASGIGGGGAGKTGAGSSAAKSGPSSAVVFENVRIMTMGPDGVIERGRVVVDDGVIVAVERAGEPATAP
ncbi:MAG: hypothetical protein AAFY22_15295, partial [Pseudomonadota bacterium]